MINILPLNIFTFTMEDSPSRGTSLRTRDQDPVNNDRHITTSIPQPNSLVRESKMLSVGGKGGRPYRDCHKWEFFPKKDSAPPPINNDEDILGNVFTSIADLSETKIEYDDEYKCKDSCSYQIMNTDALETLINDTCVCRCAPEAELDSFLRFCANKQGTFSLKHLRKLRR